MDPQTKTDPTNKQEVDRRAQSKKPQSSKSDLKKFLPLGVLVLFVAALIGGLIYYFVISARVAPQNIRVTNVSSNSATVTWTTENASPGVVIYSEKNSFMPMFLAKSGKQKAYDDRDYSKAEIELFEELTAGDNSNGVDVNLDEQKVEVTKKDDYYVHHVTLRNLESQKKYYFRVGNGTVFSAPKDQILEDEFSMAQGNSLTTVAEVEDVISPNPTYGSVYDDNDKRVSDGVMYMVLNPEVNPSAPMSSVLNKEGRWYVDISNARKMDGSTYGKIDEGSGKERVFIEGGPRGKSIIKSIPMNEDAPANKMIVSLSPNEYFSYRSDKNGSPLILSSFACDGTCGGITGTHDNTGDCKKYTCNTSDCTWSQVGEATHPDCTGNSGGGDNGGGQEPPPDSGCSGGDCEYDGQCYPNGQNNYANVWCCGGSWIESDSGCGGSNPNNNIPEEVQVPEEPQTCTGGNCCGWTNARGRFCELISCMDDCPLLSEPPQSDEDCTPNDVECGDDGCGGTRNCQDPKATCSSTGTCEYITYIPITFRGSEEEPEEGLNMGLKTFLPRGSFVTKVEARTFTVDDNFALSVDEDGVYTIVIPGEGRAENVRLVEGEEYIFVLDENANGEVDDGERIIELNQYAVNLDVAEDLELFDIELEQGFNFRSFEYLPNAMDSCKFIEELNDESESLITMVSRFESGKFETTSYREDTDEPVSGECFPVVPGRGYVIRALTEPDTVKLDGYKLNAPAGVSFDTAGWHLIGVNGNSKAYTAESLIDSIDELNEEIDADNVTKWEDSRNIYMGLQKETIDGEEEVFGFDFPIESRKSYFVRIVEGAGVWTPE